MKITCYNSCIFIVEWEPWTKSFLQLIQLVGVQNIQRNIVMKTKEKHITKL